MTATPQRMARRLGRLTGFAQRSRACVNSGESGAKLGWRPKSTPLTASCHFSPNPRPGAPIERRGTWFAGSNLLIRGLRVPVPTRQHNRQSQFILRIDSVFHVCKSYKQLKSIDNSRIFVVYVSQFQSTVGQEFFAFHSVRRI